MIILNPPVSTIGNNHLRLLNQSVYNELPPVNHACDTIYNIVDRHSRPYLVKGVVILNYLVSLKFYTIIVVWSEWILYLVGFKKVV